MSNTFQLTISSYNTTCYSGQASYCGIMTVDGSLGFKAHHEPMLAILKDRSAINYTDASGMQKSISAASGMLSFKNNQCIIVADILAKK